MKPSSPAAAPPWNCSPRMPAHRAWTSVLHDTTLYTSIFRVDDAMIVNFRIYGSAGRNNLVPVLARHHEPRLWATPRTGVYPGLEPRHTLTAKG